MRLRFLISLILCVGLFSFSFSASTKLENFWAELEKINNLDKRFLGDTRDSLLQAVKEKDVESTRHFVDVLSDSAYEEHALDKSELIQIFFLTDQLDSAIITLAKERVRSIECDDEDERYCRVQNMWFSAFNDNLTEYLYENMDLSKVSNIQEQLNRVANSDIEEEYKELAELMKDVMNGEFLNVNRPYVCDSACQAFNYGHREAGRAHRFGYDRNSAVERDTLFYDSLISRLDDYQKRYPNSKFNLLIQREKHDAESRRGMLIYVDRYYEWYYYTGGFGAEAFISPSNESYEWNIVLQYQRFVLTVSYSLDDDYHSGWNILAGFDAFENKYFKIVPFIGGYDPWMAGLQLEFRPWISNLYRDVISFGSYFSIKAKYVFKYGENGCEAGTGKDGKLRCYVDGSPDGRERDKKLAKHRFYLGVGFHIW